jgi:hypothetical protein
MKEKTPFQEPVFEEPGQTHCGDCWGPIEEGEGVLLDGLNPDPEPGEDENFKYRIHQECFDKRKFSEVVLHCEMCEEPSKKKRASTWWNGSEASFVQPVRTISQPPNLDQIPEDERDYNLGEVVTTNYGVG